MIQTLLVQRQGSVMPNAIGQGRNRLLELMPDDALGSICRSLEPAELPMGAILIEANTPILDAHFVLDGIAVQMSEGNHGHLELGLVGREGLSAPCLLLGSTHTPDRTTMAVAGSSLRISAPALTEAVACCEPLRRFLLRYAQVRHVASADSALSAGRFNIEQRTARLLLMSADRVDGDLIPITQAFLSSVLGARRASITDAIQSLKRDRSIQETRGWIAINDRNRLLQKAAGSYGIAEAEYERLLALPAGARRAVDRWG